jgi:hypothetical protein
VNDLKVGVSACELGGRLYTWLYNSFMINVFQRCDLVTYEEVYLLGKLWVVINWRHQAYIIPDIYYNMYNITMDLYQINDTNKS